MRSRKLGLSPRQDTYYSANYNMTKIMGKEPVTRKSVCALATCALTLACFQPPATAAATPKDLSQEINDLRSTVIAAEVYLVPRSTSGRIDFTEGAAVGLACNYQASDKKEIDSLIDVLADSGIVEQVGPASGYDTRAVVYLHTADSTIAIAAGYEFATGAVLGTYNRALPVGTKPGFIEDLRHWAAPRKIAKTTMFCSGT